jgi:hypothetical protein
VRFEKTPFIIHQPRKTWHAAKLTFGKTRPQAVSWNCNFVFLMICTIPRSAYMTHIKAQAQSTNESAVQKTKILSPEEWREKNRDWEEDKGSSSRKLDPIRETE